MTSLTGQTEQRLPGTIDPPAFSVALGGAVLELSIFVYVWSHYTSASDCLQSPYACLSEPAQADPWGILATATLCLIAPATWMLSLFLGWGKETSDPSIVDRLWSTIPVFYVWYLLLNINGGALLNPRLFLMALLVTLWGGRLTYNFVIKGGFSGGEDYRWKETRKWFPGLQFEIFNLVFICFFQHALILGFTTPAAVALENNTALNILDLIAALAFIFFLVGEAIADAQMFAYQAEKYRRLDAGEPAEEYARGFLETGLYSFSRHPNYFCEVSMWWCFYLFSVAATAPSLSAGFYDLGGWLNWSFIGPFFLTVLFVAPNASVDVTEALSSRKYKHYPEYQQRVNRFVPWFPKTLTKTD